ncbi:curli production assembly/transport component CsgF [Larkinella soli]|uniref:curli production assembly/transport component CsgF n=1 Tax=Larkinella soli TaxID=1770527 RepID=UPI000FFC44E2|nr:curli production assembly/transport component CsgF [Larkinella soli]
MKKILLSALFLLSGTAALKAQALTYQPKNPAFGGNSFNAQWLLGSAQAQDTYKDPNAKKTGPANGLNGASTLQNFTDNLQRQLLSRITQDLIGKQFGEEGLKEGTFTFGEMQVTVSNGTEGVMIRVTDGKGGESTITVPYF